MYHSHVRLGIKTNIDIHVPMKKRNLYICFSQDVDRSNIFYLLEWKENLKLIRS